MGFEDIITKEKDDKILLKIPRKMVDELYAMHGQGGLDGLCDISSQFIGKAIDAQVANNLKKNINYYDILKAEIFKKLICKRNNND